MNNQNNINALDEALRVIWLESSKEADISHSEREIQNILNTDYSVEMAASKQSLMMEKLSSTLSTPSFGHVLNIAMNQKEITAETLSIKTNLPLEIIEDLMVDNIYTNNVPIILFKGLLKHLALSFKSVEMSIWKTFNTLKNKEFVNQSFIAQPAFRRNPNKSRDSFLKLNSKADGKELFENVESLKKYLSKLENLMQ
ncbi:hypothetical protein MASR2M41_02920 [Flammeovirgaceae bacterium]